MKKVIWMFFGLAYLNKDYIDLWFDLPHVSDDTEIQRNTAIKYPLLWVKALPAVFERQ